MLLQALSSGSHNLLNKTQLRKELRAKRLAVSANERENAAMAAANHLVKNNLFQANQQIACYLARDDEFDTKPIIEAIWHAQKACYLPVLSSSKEATLEFVSYSQEDVLRSNRYQILEPEKTENISLEQLDIVLLPLVAFDLQGYRLGMGGGYYDKTFAFMLEKKTQKPILIGLAYELQCVEAVPRNEWDVPLAGVLTEKRMLLFNSH